jgi:hypothetical protein
MTDDYDATAEEVDFTVDNDATCEDSSSKDD